MRKSGADIVREARSLSEEDENNEKCEPSLKRTFKNALSFMNQRAFIK